MRRAAHVGGRDPLLAEVRLDVPTVVYFTTPMCHVCKTQQSPLLEHLQQAAGVRVDAVEQPEAAERWRVLTAPTTFVLDEQGIPRAVNNGFADEATLKRQLGLN